MEQNYEPVVKAVGLTKLFRDFWNRPKARAVNGIDFEVRPGEVVDGGQVCGVVPKNTKRRLLWDLGDYYCAYPELTVRGGKGATVRWGWTESLRDAKGEKGFLASVPSR